MTRLATWTTNTAGYLFTNRVHVFVMPALLTFFWNIDAQLPLPLAYYVMITLTTAGSYITNMYTDRAEDAINYTARYRFFGIRPRVAKATAATCYLLGFLLGLLAGWTFILYSVVVLALGGLYGWPLRLGDQHFRIKEIPVVKNLYAGVFWSAALILTPYLYAGERPGVLALLLIGIMLGANFFVELMWDVRDMAGDSESGVRTLPVLFGETAAFRILYVTHLATCLLVAIGLWQGLLHAEKSWILLVLYLPTGLLFLRRYRGLADKMWASNIFLLIVGGALLAAMFPPVFL